MTFAERITMMREKGELTQEELGRRLGVGKSTIHNWETGKTVSRDPEMLRKIEVVESEIEEHARAKRKERKERGKESLEDKAVRELMDMAFTAEALFPQRVTREQHENREWVIRVKGY